jgi:hypothetical protein
MITFASDYPFIDIFWTMIIFFAWVIWIWTLVAVLVDVFSRSDLSGWGKAGWTFFVIVLPFLGVLIYLIAHGKDMGERRLKEARARMPSGGATEIAQAKQLLDSGTISQAEFDQLKANALS